MHKGSPHYLFDPDRVGWLYRKVHRKELVSKAEVMRIYKASLEDRSDPLLREYLDKARSGLLKGKRGHPKRTPLQRFKIQMAEILIGDWAEDIKQERRALGLIRGGPLPDPSVQAADELARRLHLSMSDRSLLNAISDVRNDRI